MIDLSWHAFFEIGIDFIDQDHRQLLSIMQAVQHAVQESDYPKCSSELQRLLREAGKHFAREETFLAQTKYPQLEEHIFYHQGLLVQAERIRAICEGSTSEHDLNACFEEMSKFLVDDILRGDIRFKSHLEYGGFIRPGVGLPGID